jgi:hypothetical protein
MEKKDRRGLELIEKKLDELAYNRNLERFNRQMGMLANTYNSRVSEQERQLALKLKDLFRTKKRSIVLKGEIGRGGVIE